MSIGTISFELGCETMPVGPGQDIVCTARLQAGRTRESGSVRGSPLDHHAAWRDGPMRILSVEVAEAAKDLFHIVDFKIGYYSQFHAPEDQDGMKASVFEGWVQAHINDLRRVRAHDEVEVRAVRRYGGPAPAVFLMNLYAGPVR